MSRKGLGSGESQLETAIGYLLIGGVGLSIVLEVIGIVMYIVQTGSTSVSQAPDAFIQGRNFFTFILDVLRGQTVSTAFAFMAAGTVVLILTPFIRLVFSVFYFTGRKNLAYLFITAFVLVVISLSLALH